MTQRTAAAALALHDSVTRVRGFGRDHGKQNNNKTHLPRAVLTQCSTLSDPPTKKATLVHMQSNKTVVVDGSDADDTDALFDDAADT